MKQIVFFIFTFSFVDAHGQQFVKSYFTKDGKKSNAANSYYYSEGKTLPGSAYNVQRDTITIYVDSVFSYYSLTNKIKSKKYYNKEGKSQGGYKEYYEDGGLKEIGSYNNGIKFGDVKQFYPNGTSQRVIRFPPENDKSGSSGVNGFKTISYWDSIGTQLVTNGNGFCKCYFFSGQYKNKILREEGKLKDGLQDLTWKTYINDTLSFKEEFSKGKFLTGTRYEPGGMEITYDEIEKQAEYEGGLKKLQNFLISNLNYPIEARRKGMQGTVYVQFVVDKDGSLINIKILKSAGKLLDDEALRIISKSKKWSPAIQRGKVVKSRFVLPVIFKL